MTEKRTLLGVFAHPHDESFGPGGTLAKYAAEGANVHVIIATDGDAGSTEENHTLPNGRTLAQVRSEEMANAAIALGVTTIWNLPYRDSGMRGAPDNDHPQALIQQPIELLVTEMVEYIRRLRPQVIVTHDPFGGYGHPDHIRVCEVVTAAFYAAGEPGPSHSNGHGLEPYAPQKLYYTAFDKRSLRWIVRMMRLFRQDPTAIGRNKDINLEEIAHWHTPIHARIDVRDYLARKEMASRAHASQYGGGPSFLRVLPKPLRTRIIGKDSFMRAYPAPTELLETDLFAGVHIA
jgi:LmbE family N-acetylglucosaminyl deacetylase